MVLICAQSAEVVIPEIKLTHKFKLNVPWPFLKNPKGFAIQYVITVVVI